MKNKSNSFKKTNYIFMLLVIFAVVCLWLYNNHLKVTLDKSTEITLNEIVEQQSFNFSTVMQSQINTVKSLAISVSYMPNDEESVASFMSEALVEAEFDNIWISNLDGEALTASGEIIDISDTQYFKLALDEQNSICEPLKGISGEMIIPIFSHITRNGETVGILFCGYELSKFDNTFRASFGGNGYAFVINSQGDILTKTENNYVFLKSNNAFESLETIEIVKYDSLDTIKENVKNGLDGRLEYMLNNRLRHAKYVKLGINDWYLLAVIPQDVIASNSAPIIQGAILVTIIVILIFGSFIIYFMSIQKKTNEEREKHTKILEQVAYYDELTGLPNLNKFKIDAVRIMKENPDKDFVTAKLDIANFKVLNEMFGYEVADKVICNMAKFIAEVRREMNIEIGCIARVTADEFILLDEAEGLEETYERIRLFEEGYNLHSKELLDNHKLRFRYGRCMATKGDYDINSMIEKVNMAHRMAKQLNVAVYDYNEKIMDKHLRDAELESKMSYSLESGEFKVYLQPKYLLKNEKVVGAEALVRWELDNEIIMPNDFIPLFERNGSIVRIDMYMFEEVCKQIKSWIDNDIVPIPISVNFSRIHLRNENFINDIDRIANRYNVPKEYLEIELTESSIYENEDALREILENLHQMGFKFSMDDFGTGYSSLGLLKNLPVDTIKIDRGFFSDIAHESRAKVVIESVINMAKNLSIDTVAEGVETREHIDLLRQIGCDIVQGYYYAKPMPQEEFSRSMSKVEKILSDKDKEEILN